MGLIKTSLLSAVAVVIKMATMLGINKVLAIYVGPAGYAAIGQFQNLIQVVTTLATGAVNTGVTKYTAEYYDDEKKQVDVWRTAGSITLFCSISFSLLVYLTREELALELFGDTGFKDVFLYFSISLIFFSTNMLLLSILNGKKELYSYISANIIGSFISLFVTVFLVIKAGLFGALIALAIYQSLTCAVTLFLCVRKKWFSPFYLFGVIDKSIARNLLKFTAMALTSAICIPLTQILIRTYLIDYLGPEEAGYWEAMWRLSAAYLLVITTTLSVYFLPRISEIKSIELLRIEIVNGYKIIIPFVILISSLVFLTKDWIINFLFSEDFLAMRVLFGWQMLGDTFKIASWILAYVMLGKAMAKLYITTEIIFAANAFLMTFLLTKSFGLEGASMAYAINYFIYLLIMIYLVFFRHLSIAGKK